MKPVVQLTVVGNSRAPLCQADCGMDWSLPETLAQARQALQEQFGDRVEIKYADVARSKKAPKQTKSTSYPLLMVDGNIRLAGQFDLRQVIDVAETEIEMAVTR